MTNSNVIVTIFALINSSILGSIQCSSSTSQKPHIFIIIADDLVSETLLFDFPTFCYKVPTRTRGRTLHTRVTHATYHISGMERRWISRLERNSNP